MEQLSPSNNKSNIERCNNRLINSTNPKVNSENEVTKTIEVGTAIRYNMKDHEIEVPRRKRSCYPMNVLSINANGVGSAPKKKWLRKLCFDNRVSFIGIQESKSKNENCSFIHSLWGNSNCDFTIKKSQGNSGGIIGIGNASITTRKLAFSDETSLVTNNVKGGHREV
ncbi:RNA-directed DNA polymerase, eukaryota [Tanacetum coccineum]